MKQSEYFESSDLKQSNSEISVMEFFSKKSSSSTATTGPGPFTSGPKLKSSEVEIVKIKHTTSFYRQIFIEEINQKKRSLKDSSVKNKHTTELEAFPNINPAVIWNSIENLDMELVLLFTVTLILKAHAIERLYCYVSRCDDNFIISSFESPSSIGFEFTPQDMLDTLKPLITPVCQAIILVRCEDRP